jgi:hypothetical protein
MNSDPRISTNQDPPRRAFPRPRSCAPPPPLGLGSARGENRSCAPRTTARRSVPAAVSGWREPPCPAPSALRVSECLSHRASGSPPAAPVRVCSSSSQGPLEAEPALRPVASRTARCSRRRRRAILCSSSHAGIPRPTRRSYTGPRKVCSRRSIGLFRSFHPDLCTGLSATIAPTIKPMSTSRSLAGSRSGWSQTHGL